MSKELEALAILKQTIFHYTLGCLATGEEKAFKVIETALKRLEKIDNTKLIIMGNPSPDESAIDKLINHSILSTEPQQMEIKPLYDESDEKKLEAFEIIKECVGLKMSVDEDIGCLYVPIIKCFQPLEQNIIVVGYVKGKDKIELLKEVLKDEQKS